MADCFAFFCEDVREEVGNKTSYMGVLGPHITLSENPTDDARGVLSKLVAVGMLRTTTDGVIVLKVEILFENAPEGVADRLETLQEVPLTHNYDDTMAQFHAVLPNIPAHPGLRVTVNFTAREQTFGATLTIHGPDQN